MSTMQYINMSLDIFGALMCAIILIFMVASDQKKDSLNTVFLLMIIFNIGMLLTDIAICLLDGKPGQLVHFLFSAAFFLIYTLGPVTLTAFTLYNKIFMSRKAPLSKVTLVLICTAVTVCVIDILFIIISQFNGMCFFIDENNQWHSGDWFWICLSLPFVSIALNGGIIFSHHKYLEKREIIILSSYVGLPALALIVLAFVNGISIINFSITLTILIFYAGIQSEQAMRLKHKEMELLEARIDIMLSQIQPHFLYNTLTTIETLCRKNGQQAAELVNNFSCYLRDNMESLNQKELVVFDRELEHTKVYLEIEKSRYKERFGVEYDLAITDFYLPILTVQPLVENAVRHGVAKNRERVTIRIATREVADGVQITVTDNGVGFEPSQTADDGHTHIGLANVRNRLEAQCGGTLTIESSISAGTTATLFIPNKKEGKV